MKNILSYIILVLILTGCKKEFEPVLEDPDTRLIKVLDEYKTLLTTAPNGWKAFTFPGGGGGYAFYFKFNADNSVSMYSDMDTVAGLTSKGSTWRLKALQQPSLIFDTYTYIHKLSDPDETKSGGTRGKGLLADFEFAFVRVSGDSVIMEGTFNRSPLVMVKATAAEAADVAAGKIKTVWKAHEAYLKANANPSIQFADGKKLQIDFSNKQIGLSWADPNNQVVSQVTDFAFTLNGLTLREPLTYGTNSFREILWDDVAKRYYIVINNVRTDIINAPTPVIPFMLVFGPGKASNTINVTPANSSVWSPEFTSIFNTAKTGLAAVGNNAGRILDNFYLTFPTTAEMSMRVFYRNAAGSAFQANFFYSVTWIAADRVKFTYVSRDNNANTAVQGIGAITTYLEQNEFILNWGPTGAYGGLYKATNPASYLIGTFSKL